MLLMPNRKSIFLQNPSFFFVGNCDKTLLPFNGARQKLDQLFRKWWWYCSCWWLQKFLTSISCHWTIKKNYKQLKKQWNLYWQVRFKLELWYCQDLIAVLFYWVLKAGCNSTHFQAILRLVPLMWAEFIEPKHWPYQFFCANLSQNTRWLVIDEYPSYKRLKRLSSRLVIINVQVLMYLGSQKCLLCI